MATSRRRHGNAISGACQRTSEDDATPLGKDRCLLEQAQPQVSLHITVHFVHVGASGGWPQLSRCARGGSSRFYGRWHLLQPSSKGKQILSYPRSGWISSTRIEGLQFRGCIEFYLQLGVRLLNNKIVFIAASNSTAALCKRLGFKRVFVVLPGVRRDQPCLASSNFSNNYILFVGRQVKRKGLSWFITNVLPHLGIHLTLKVAGPKWDRDEWAAVAGNNRVEYLGCVDRSVLAELRRDALAVIMPNINTNGADIEGFGLTAIEAAADGGVLIATGIEGIVDAVIDGETGFLVANHDVDGWIERIEKIAKWTPQQRASFVASAVRQIDKFYSWERVAHQVEEVYRIANSC